MKYNLEKIAAMLEVAKHKPGKDGWFFPCDIVPHSSALKYACKKFVKLGKMEAQGEKGDRWGYKYRIKPDAMKTER